jgi:hypothetical protein
VRGFRSTAPLARLHYLLLTAGVFVILAGAVHWNLLPWKLLA